MAYRAEKSGFAAAAQGKINDKWDPASSMEAMTWVSQATGEALPAGFNTDKHDMTHEFLKDGYVLVKLATYAKSGSVKASLMGKRPTMAFKQMELIGVFLAALKTHKLVQDNELFQTVDLYESQNMSSVIITIAALGRSLQKEGRGFGKAESVGEKREFTEEQLKAGSGIIGLQMGTNKGANASGVNMGKSRAIMD